MAKARKEDNTYDSKRQTMALVGMALIVLAGIIIYVSLSSPRVYDSGTVRCSQLASDSDSTSVAESNDYRQESVGVSYPLDLNTATLEELMTIDGLGQKRASDIISYRKAKGGYKSVEEIKNIKGIGDNLFYQVAPYLTV